MPQEGLGARVIGCGFVLQVAPQDAGGDEDAGDNARDFRSVVVSRQESPPRTRDAHRIDQVLAFLIKRKSSAGYVAITVHSSLFPRPL